MGMSDIKEKIRLILNLANDSGAHEGEIDAAMRFASVLMAKYHISEKDMENYSNGNDKAAIYDRMCAEKTYSHTLKLAKWEEYLASFCCSFVGSVQCYINNGRETVKNGALVVMGTDGFPKVARAFVFYGPDEEVRLATELYNEISMIIATTARLRFGSVMKSSGGDYGRGVVNGLNKRLFEQKQLLTTNSESTALVVQSDKMIALKKDLAKKWLSAEKDIRLSKTKKQSKQTTFDGNAFNLGMKDSEKIELNKKKTLRLT